MSESSPDYSQISGFYGPGTWAAWVITLVTSWIPILRNDHKHNLHYVTYALYTNWASVDLIRQMNQAHQHAKDFGEVDPAHSQNIIAALAVVRVGIFNAWLQIAVCHQMARDQNADTRKNIGRRLWCIIIGSLLPVPVNFLVVPCFHEAIAGDVTLGDFIFTVAVQTGSLMILAQCFAFVDIHRDILTLFYALCRTVVLCAAVWGTFHSSDSFLDNRCYVVPCAPQTIAEMDQAFSLLVALVFLLYEYFGTVFQLARKALRGVRGSMRRSG